MTPEQSQKIESIRARFRPGDLTAITNLVSNTFSESYVTKVFSKDPRYSQALVDIAEQYLDKRDKLLETMKQ